MKSNKRVKRAWRDARWVDIEAVDLSMKSWAKESKNPDVQAWLKRKRGR